jgi:hypothetical protein
MSGRVDASVLPNLDAFDEEFGRDESEVEPAAPRLNRGFRFSTVIALALAAGLITAVALAWPIITGVSDPAYEKPEATIERLTRELEALKQENQELAEAQQAATNTIRSLQAAQQEQRAPMSSWYSEPAALTFGIATQSESSTNGRRSAIARPRPREVPRRDEAAPISLDPQ